MHLKVLLPTAVLVDETVSKVIAEAQDGAFCLLPKHVDFVAALVPGILQYWTQAGERFLAVDEGTLVKCGTQVLVSTRNAVAHRSLDALKATVSKEFHLLDEHERQARTALGRLEASAMRRFLELQERMHG